MMKFHLLIGVLFCMLVNGMAVGVSYAQDEKSEETQTDEKSDETKSEETTQEPGLVDQVKVLVSDGDIRDAAELIEKQIASQGDDVDVVQVQLAYQIIYAGFTRIRNEREAYKQIKKLLDFQLQRIEDDQVKPRITSTIVRLKSISQRVNKADEVNSLVKEVLDKLEPMVDYETPDQLIAQVSTLKAMYCAQLSADGKKDEAQSILDEQFERVTKLHESHPDDEIATAVYLSTLTFMMQGMDESERKTELFETHQSMVRGLLEKSPGQVSYVAQFVRAASTRAGVLMKTDTDSATELLDEAKKVLLDCKKANPESEPRLTGAARAVATLERRIQSEIKISALLDSDAPEFDANAWVNGEELSTKDLEGKVILVDFWAVWCGPCIKTFPHLKHLHETYSDQGLAMIGSTRYYNFEWDADTSKAKRVQREVSADEENDVIASFMEHHDLPYPTIVMPKDSTMSSDFGVVGIPHVVLIDRKGKVRMIKVGSRPETAKEIEDKIKELLAE